MQEKNIVNKNKVVTLNLIQGLPRLSWLLSLRNGVRGRFRIKYGMTPNFMGFTLIELLVVVLIIGILAAVALPQYQQAVLKSRIQPYMTLLKTLATAKHTHYMATGQYVYDINLLDVEMPASCWETGGGSVGQLWSCGKDFHIDNTAGGFIFYYCPGKNSTHTECVDNKELQFSAAEDMRGFGSCAGYTARGRKFCAGFAPQFAAY